MYRLSVPELDLRGYAGRPQIIVATPAAHIWNGSASMYLDLFTIISTAKKVAPEILNAMVTLGQKKCYEIAGIGQMAVVALNDNVLLVDPMRGVQPLVIGRFHLVAVRTRLRR